MADLVAGVVEEQKGPRVRLARDVRSKHRRVWRENPVELILGELGVPLWSAQIDILNALREESRVAVRSCNGSGKTYAAACAVIWWLMAWDNAIAITTAPTQHQVKDLLWREIARIHRRNADLIGGTLNQESLEIAERKYAIGLSTDQAERFQGFHETNILFVVDEASGVSEQIYEAIEGCMTSKRARLLLIGNPIRRSGTFFEAFHSERDLWYPLHISALDTPNLISGESTIDGLVTPKWVQNAGRKWGTNSPLFQIRVLGDFPSRSIDTLLDLNTVEAAVFPPLADGQRTSTSNIFPDPTGTDPDNVEDARCNRQAAAGSPDFAEEANTAKFDASNDGRSSLGASPVAAGLARPPAASNSALPDDHTRATPEGGASPSATQDGHPEAPEASIPSPLGGEGQGEGIPEKYHVADPEEIGEALEGHFSDLPPRELATTPIIIGVDVARFGDAKTVIAIRKGDTVVSLESWAKQDTMVTVGRIINAIQEHEPEKTYIDEVGVGGGVLDRLKEQKIKGVRGINVGLGAEDPEKYLNLRAEYFDYMRELFESERIRIPNDRELIAQLTGIRYSFTSTGQMKVEDKDSLRRQGLPSPDKADALTLAFAPHKLSNNYKIWV